jgi:hypothetical protein
MDKKGEFNLGTVQAVVIALLVIGVLGVAGMLALSTLSSSVEKTVSGSLVNETQTFYNATLGGTPTSVYLLKNIALSSVVILNGTTVIPSSNYTIVGGTITAHATSPYRDNSVKISAVYTYSDSSGTSDVSGNFTHGIGKFINTTPTFMILLSVVVLISIIAIVIVAVTKFSSPSANL